MWLPMSVFIHVKLNPCKEALVRLPPLLSECIHRHWLGDGSTASFHSIAFSVNRIVGFWIALVLDMCSFMDQQLLWFYNSHTAKGTWWEYINSDPNTVYGHRHHQVICDGQTESWYKESLSDGHHNVQLPMRCAYQWYNDIDMEDLRTTWCYEMYFSFRTTVPLH